MKVSLERAYSQAQKRSRPGVLLPWTLASEQGSSTPAPLGSSRVTTNRDSRAPPQTYCIRTGAIYIFPGGSDGEESSCNAGGLASIPGLGRSPGEGDVNPLQYSCISPSPPKEERYKHLNAEFQRISRRDKKAFLSDQCKEIEENNRMGKTRDLSSTLAWKIPWMEEPGRLQSMGSLTVGLD